MPVPPKVSPLIEMRCRPPLMSAPITERTSWCESMWLSAPDTRIPMSPPKVPLAITRFGWPLMSKPANGDAVALGDAATMLFSMKQLDISDGAPMPPSSDSSGLGWPEKRMSTSRTTLRNAQRMMCVPAAPAVAGGIEICRRSTH